MKKITFKYISFIAGILVWFQFSCNKNVDLKPINEISDADYWKTAEQYKLAANEFYTYLISFAQVLYDPFAANTNAGSPHSDIRSDLVAQRNVFSNGTNPSVTTDGNWNSAYTRLRAINYLLSKDSADMSNTARSERLQYVAEAKFFRAYVYFDLLQQFGGVPVITRPLDINSPELQTPRGTREQVVDLIIKDLEEAIAFLPLESAINAANKGRISKGAAQAFLGRVTLYEGSWQKFRNGNAARYNALLDKSIAASDSVIASNQYQLFAPAALGDSALKYLFILEDEKSNPAGIGKSGNKEYILANRFSFSLRQIRQNVTHTWVNSALSKKFVDMFLAQDGLPVNKSSLFQGYAMTRSEFTNRDNRMRYTMMIDSNYYWDNENPGARSTWLGDAADIASSRGRHNAANGTGYQNQKWGTERRMNDNEEGYDWPVLRLAEVYLNYAEAIFERNGSISNADLDKSLNKVRNRVNKTMPKLSNELVTTNNLDMRTEIRRERTIELFLEGFRMDDLKRWKTAETEMPMDVLGVKWKGTRWESRWLVNGKAPYNLDANGNLIFEGSRQWAEKNYLLPIPTQQIQLNPNLTQNPGW
ncbi:RagB/SusD family nutrient uptake outer membrane protein [Chitinophagaceae bacterium LB-8]|uniref:RagB/SusD family nutrient uptake outer membrane protein n=1 Tax=Paraflavisolibacter caeni TaxID=2982496 RepID=A0A9X2XXT6_9BACT|nr:RagB/SusD family nutrient uptake outer membrane protein [Paraflavisolibacter caeni]MCU7549663.1 RagB/SusD family nutrient uptake outer membrane protein [Paraflavisolibacter caeni]